MFSFLKKQTARPASAADASAPDTSTAPHDDRQHDEQAAPAPPASADPEHPLAAMVWDSPDVPRADEPAAGDGAAGGGGQDYGLDVAALVEPPAQASDSGFGPKDQARTDALKPMIVEALSTVYDPEIPVNIYELGLIYDIVSDAESRVTVTMTLTSPACPAAQQLPSEVKYKTKAVEGVADAYVDVVWEPPWTKDMMSEAAKLGLGIF